MFDSQSAVQHARKNWTLAVNVAADRANEAERAWPYFTGRIIITLLETFCFSALARPISIEHMSVF